MLPVLTVIAVDGMTLVGARAQATANGRRADGAVPRWSTRRRDDDSTARDATTHPNSMQELAQYCARTRTDRVVDAGDVVTARGVTSAIDLGLYLIGRIADAKAQREIAAQMDYPHFGKM